MRRTVSIKLDITPEQHVALALLQKAFNKACNVIASIAMENRCWNRVALHHLSYHQIRHDQANEQVVLGSQMVCNAIRTVCDAYKVLKIKKTETVPAITFKQGSSVHFDKRTYSLKDGAISLYTLSGRILVQMNAGNFQQSYLQRGSAKEAELICRRGKWFFNLVLDIQDSELLISKGNVLGVDLGENNLAATSSGKLFRGEELRHERDYALALRKRL